jgi:hypothetical protein
VLAVEGAADYFVDMRLQVGPSSLLYEGWGWLSGV